VKIAFIGIGNVGAALADRLASLKENRLQKSGNTVVIAARDAQSETDFSR
jgi:predicted dinucleotide-binding enzyme